MPVTPPINAMHHMAIGKVTVYRFLVTPDMNTTIIMVAVHVRNIMAPYIPHKPKILPVVHAVEQSAAPHTIPVPPAVRVILDHTVIGTIGDHGRSVVTSDTIQTAVIHVRHVPTSQTAVIIIPVPEP